MKEWIILSEHSLSTQLFVNKGPSGLSSTKNKIQHICVVCVGIPKNVVTNSETTQGWRRPHGFLPQLDEFYFTTAEKKLLENCRGIVPNFTND